MLKETGDKSFYHFLNLNNIDRIIYYKPKNTFWKSRKFKIFILDCIRLFIKLVLSK